MAGVADYLERVRGLAPLVRAHAARSEEIAQLAPEIAEAFHEAGLYRILLPARLEGGELTLPESLRVFETVARLDGSAGWNLSICADGPLFGHFISRQAFEEIFGDRRAVLAGSLNPTTTRAVPCDGGWRYSGKASYVSGSAQASWIMTAGVVLRDGSPGLVGDVPVMRAGIFPMARCKILSTWAVSGMRGTGSNDCVFEEVFVPDGFTYEWPNPRPTWSAGPFSAIQLATQLGGGLASIVLGVAQHAIDALKEIAVAKVPLGTRATLAERPLAQMQLAQAEGWLRAGRTYLYAANDEVWRLGGSGAAFDAPERAAARLAAVTAVKLAAQAVDLVHDAAGMNAVQTSCDIERCWRDVHTMTQHVILGTGRFEVIGRVLLGLPPGSPII
jgi:alkylation response protein AidB-like acyl-CoA dehydrogenase